MIKQKIVRTIIRVSNSVLETRLNRRLADPFDLMRSVFFLTKGLLGELWVEPLQYFGLMRPPEDFTLRFFEALLLKRRAILKNLWFCCFQQDISQLFCGMGMS